MTKLTNSDIEDFPADQEDNDDFLRDLSDDESPYFSGPEDTKSRAIRDLANGKNLNNSFGAITPDDWGHLHADKGANP